MKYDSLIFDLDGTLWNALKNTAIGWTNGLQSLGINKTVTEYELSNVVGKPFEDCVNSLLPGIIDHYPELIARLDYHERILVEEQGGNLYPNVVNGIKSLSKLYNLFVVSNCQEWYLEAFLNHTQTRNHFTAYDCHGKSNLSKSEMIKNIVNNYNLKTPVYIGDTLSDCKSSEEAGVVFIHAEYGFGKIENYFKTVKDFNSLVVELLN